MKVIPKNKQDKAKAKILQAVMDNWQEKNPDFENDIMELSSKIVLFEAKWGVKINFDLTKN